MSTCDYCDQPAVSEWDHYDVTVTTCGNCHPDDEEN